MILRKWDVCYIGCKREGEKEDDAESIFIRVGQVDRADVRMTWSYNKGAQCIDIQNEQ